ncbi:hypothetical protein JOC24_002827 [Streptomyces sp. HB132]|nr:hypothetical protein [Streptomyces sp. HB132]
MPYVAGPRSSRSAAAVRARRREEPRRHPSPCSTDSRIPPAGPTRGRARRGRCGSQCAHGFRGCRAARCVELREVSERGCDASPSYRAQGTRSCRARGSGAGHDSSTARAATGGPQGPAATAASARRRSSGPRVFRRALQPLSPPDPMPRYQRIAPDDLLPGPLPHLLHCAAGHHARCIPSSRSLQRTGCGGECRAACHVHASRLTSTLHTRGDEEPSHAGRVLPGYGRDAVQAPGGRPETLAGDFPK